MGFKVEEAEPFQGTQVRRRQEQPGSVQWKRSLPKMSFTMARGESGALDHKPKALNPEPYGVPTGLLKESTILLQGCFSFLSGLSGFRV